MTKRKGVLLHFSSLPGDFGIGDFGPNSIAFAGFLVEQGYSIWQVLPLNHRGYGNSPYNPISAFALDPLLISPERLYEDGLIEAKDMEKARLSAYDRVLFEQVYRAKGKLNQIAAQSYLSRHDISGFIEDNAFWIKPYIAFLTLDKLYGDIHWSSWQAHHRTYSEALWKELLSGFEPSMLAHAAVQAILRDQLHDLKSELNKQGIELWGDMPIYLSYHSAEVWAHPELFQLDHDGRRLQVAGVPPDAFSEDGQLWGNPIYRWHDKTSEVFELFERRSEDALSYLNRMRLDHFIGYVNYWSVSCPVSEDQIPQMPEHAREGSWIPAPAEQLFARLTDRFGAYPFIAEDLGILTEEVCRVRERFGFPGMIVLQFCWHDSVPRVEDYPADRVIYTGTHDNQTTRQWFEELDPESNEYRHFISFVAAMEHQSSSFGVAGNKEPILNNTDTIVNVATSASIMMEIALQSGCQICIFPMQDILGLGAQARMNIPGTPLGNWEWRMKGIGIRA